MMKYLYSFIFVIYSPFIYSSEICPGIGRPMHHQEKDDRWNQFAQENNVTIVFAEQSNGRSKRLFKVEDGRVLTLDILIKKQWVEGVPCSYCSAILTCNHYYKHQGLHRMRRELSKMYPDRKSWSMLNYLEATASYIIQKEEEKNQL